jgi:hypothetical protein
VNIPALATFNRPITSECTPTLALDTSGLRSYATIDFLGPVR